LQVGVVAAGGSVVRNPRGREFGFARRIQLNSAGRHHAMFQGKPDVFEAITVHVDRVETLPAGATPLAHNEMGLQAAGISLANGAEFWGVQYHPEYSIAESAAMARRYAPALIKDGLFRDQADLDAYATDLLALQTDPADARLAWRFGIGAAVTDAHVRLAEIRNWLECKVLR
jgi:GMP synthase (glutamine-hydrolysing)